MPRYPFTPELLDALPEELAEAVSDVYSNGDRAKAFSKEIVRVIKKRLK